MGNSSSSSSKGLDHHDDSKTPLLRDDEKLQGDDGDFMLPLLRRDDGNPQDDFKLPLLYDDDDDDDDDDEHDDGNGGDNDGHDDDTIQERMMTLYKWKIDGFSSLLKVRDASGYRSGYFKTGGYDWFLNLIIGNCYISLGLNATNVGSYSQVVAKYNLLIYNQKHNKMIKKIGTACFTSVDIFGPSHYMIPVHEFMSPSLGFLTNDSCIIGVEILRVFHTPICKVVSQCLSLFIGPKTPVSYTWKFEGCPRPDSSSEAFIAGGYKWYIVIFPYFWKEDKYISLFLDLDSLDSKRLESLGAYVEYSLCIKNQIHGEHKKLTKDKVFSFGDSVSGWQRFLSYEEFIDPTNGFLVDNCCTVEASIAVLGLLSSK